MVWLVSILSFLFKFMYKEQRSQLLVSLVITRCIGMKHPNIKIHPAPETSAWHWMSPQISSLLTDGGSTATSSHTSWSQLAVKSLSSLWWMKVKLLWWEIVTWFALNEVPQWLGTLDTHTSIIMHLEILVYSNKNPAPEWGEQLAKVTNILHYTEHVNSETV